jgi:hypothetical protein
MKRNGQTEPVLVAVREWEKARLSGAFSVEQRQRMRDMKNEFLNFVKMKFNIEKLSTKLRNWYELDYKEFLSELTKAKVKMPLEEQFSWQSLFEIKANGLVYLDASS